MGRSRYPLRLHPSLMEEARKVAESQGVALNQLFNVAVAEKLAAMRTVKRFQERIRRAGRPEPLPVLYQARTWNPPMQSDELPLGGLQGFGRKPQPEVQPATPPDSEGAGEIIKVFGRATPQFGKLKRRLEKTRGR